MSNNLGLRFGGMAPSIADQLNEQGFLFSKSEVSHFQKDADAVTRLRIRGLIPAAQVDKSFNKITKLIAAHVDTYGKFTKDKK